MKNIGFQVSQGKASDAKEMKGRKVKGNGKGRGLAMGKDNIR